MRTLQVWALLSWALGVAMLGFDGDQGLGVILALVSAALIAFDTVFAWKGWER